MWCCVLERAGFPRELVETGVEETGSVLTSGDFGLPAYPVLLDDEDILADGAEYGLEWSTLALDEMLGCLTDAGAPEGEGPEMLFPIEWAAN
jgi:hypothetical protein